MVYSHVVYSTMFIFTGGFSLIDVTNCNEEESRNNSQRPSGGSEVSPTKRIRTTTCANMSEPECLQTQEDCSAEVKPKIWSLAETATSRTQPTSSQRQKSTHAHHSLANSTDSRTVSGMPQTSVFGAGAASAPINESITNLSAPPNGNVFKSSRTKVSWSQIKMSKDEKNSAIVDGENEHKNGNRSVRYSWWYSDPNGKNVRYLWYSFRFWFIDIIDNRYTLLLIQDEQVLNKIMFSISLTLSRTEAMLLNRELLSRILKVYWLYVLEIIRSTIN